MSAIPRLFVRMVQPRFAAKVSDHLKRQTVRPHPKRMPRAGDRISLREWTEKPYRSKQRELCQGTITAIDEIAITKENIFLDGPSMFIGSNDEFAVADGFRDFADMKQWFQETHGLPFSGIVIYWRPDQQ